MKQLLLKLIAGLEPRFLSKTEQDFIHTLDQEYLRTEDGMLRFNSRFKPGIIKKRKDGTLFFSPLDEGSPVFLPPEYLMDAKLNDIVLIQRIMGRSKKSAAKVVLIFDQDVTYSVGIIANGVLVELVTKTPLSSDKDETWAEQQKTGDLFLLNNKNNTILKALGSIDDPTADEAIALALYNKQSVFSSAVHDEVAKFGKTVTQEDIKGRVDLRDLNFTTIDPVTAKDFDDAICYDVQNNILYVAIADVSHYVQENSAIDETAYERGFTIYFPHKSVPMLPRELSENLCSLMPHVDRLAFVFEIHLNIDQITVKHSKVYEAVIQSKRRFNYEEIDTLFENPHNANELDASLFPDLQALAEVMNSYRAARMEKGYAFRSPEIEMRLNDKGLIENTTVAQETPSHALVEDCMLLANKAAAHSFEKGLYRVHDVPTLAKLDNLYHQLSLLGLRFKLSSEIKQTINSIQQQADIAGLREDVDTLLIQTQMQAHYSHQNIGHFGLGFQAYTHFTSPIRRYSDLIVHRLIKAHINSNTDYIARIEQSIEAIAVSVSEKERQVDQCAKNLEKRKYARYAKEHLGETILAKITYIGEAPKAISISPIVGIECTLDTLSVDTKLFETIEVELLSSDITTLIVTAKQKDIDTNEAI